MNNYVRYLEMYVYECYNNKQASQLKVSGVTESFFFFFFFGGGGAKGGQTFIWRMGGGGGQEDGIAMKGAQSKVKWGPMWGPMVWIVREIENPLVATEPYKPYKIRHNLPPRIFYYMYL